MSWSPATPQTFEPPSIRAARRAGWNSLAVPSEKSTADDENSPLNSSRMESECDERLPTAQKSPKAHSRRFKSENPASPADVDETESQTLAALAAVQMLDSCWTLPVEYIPTEWAGSPPTASGDTTGEEPVPVMISTLTMHVKYGRSTNMSDNTTWGLATGPRRMSQPWKSVWRSGYDGPWSSTSDRSGARDSLEKASEPTRSRYSMDNGSSNSATERLRQLRLRAKGRYRRALNVSEASQPGLDLLPDRAVVELDRLDELEDESVVDEDRPPIPYTTCPKSAPAILLSQHESFPRPYLEHRLSLPARSLSSQSYRGLPLYTARKGAVADKIRSLGRILRRSDSSSHATTAPGVRTPLDARERRRQARDPYELHSESITSSPLFNSPSSESARGPIDTFRGIFDPLIRAGTLVATAELDRLSFLANSREIILKPSKTEPSTTSSGPSSNGDAYPNLPAGRLEDSGAIVVSQPGTGTVLTPEVPTNTPASDLASPATPNASYPTKYGQRRRGAHSRLSEVYMSDDAQKETQRESGSESSPRHADSRDQGTEMCERHDIYHSLAPKPLSMTPSPSGSANKRTEPNRTEQLNGSSPNQRDQKALDMEHLNKLLDNAISNSIITQRLIASTSSPSSLAGAHLREEPVLRAILPSQLKFVHHDAREPCQPLSLGSVGIRPFVESRASSPGPRRDPSIRNLISLSAASPVIKKHMAKHVFRSITPTEFLAVPCMPHERNLNHGDESGDMDLFRPEALGDVLGHEQSTGFEANSKQTKIRRSTSGTVLVMEAVDASDGSSSATEGSDRETPLADDGCPQEFAMLTALREQAHYIMPGTPSEKRDMSDC